MADHARAAGPIRRRLAEQGRGRQKAGTFKDEIAPVTVKERKGEKVIDTDEYIRDGATL